MNSRLRAGAASSKRLQPRALSRKRKNATISGAATLPNDALLEQIRRGVAGIDASLGRKSDADSERMTASLYARAKERGMDRVDHVVLGRAGTRAAEGECVFLVKGDPATSVYHREQIKTADAVATPVEQSLARAQKAAELQSPSLAETTRQPALETSAHSLRV